MTTLVNLDGEIVSPHAAKVSVFDRGFLFGDSVYESLRTYNGVPFLLERHLQRLHRSASRLAMDIPGSIDRVRTEVERLLKVLPGQETAFRIIVTRGSKDGVIDIDPFTATSGLLVVIGRETQGFSREHFEQGVDLAVVSVVRNRRDMQDPAVKSGNYLNNMLAIQEAKRLGAFESVMLNSEGFLTECSTSNIFLVKDGVIRTPALDCGLLDGVTRGCLFELATQAGIRSEEAKLRREDLVAADEVFLSSSFKEVMAVRSVDGSPVGAGAPGPITRRLLDLYRARIVKECGSQAGSKG